MKIPRKYYNHEAQSTRGYKRRRNEQIMTKQTPQAKHRRTNKEELQQRNHLGTVSRKFVGSFKPVLLAQNRTLNSDVNPNQNNKWASAKTQISLCIHPVWQAFSFVPQMRRLIWVFADRKGLVVGSVVRYLIYGRSAYGSSTSSVKHHIVAHIIKNTVMKIVLSQLNIF